jgi:hypothetical protein
LTTQLPVHITGYGNFLLSRIEELDDPTKQSMADDRKAKPKADTKVELMATPAAKIVEIADPAKQEPLTAEHDPGAFAAEQTWPTPEELKETKVQMHAIVEDPKAAASIEEMAIEAGIQSDSGDDNQPEPAHDPEEEKTKPPQPALESMEDAQPASIHPSDEEGADESEEGDEDEDEKEGEAKVSAK